MKNNKSFWLAVFSFLTVSSLVACSKGNGNADNSSSANESSNEESNSSYVEPEPEPEPEEEVRYEIGDTVKEWTCGDDLATLPMDAPSETSGTREIDNDFGYNDPGCLSFEIKGNSYIGTDVVEERYFTEEDAKNGDIVSLWLYLPKDHNIDTLQLQLMHGNNNSISGSSIKIDEAKEEKWFKTSAVFDTLDLLTGIRLNYTVVNVSEPAKFYVDNIEIVYGEETVKNNYEYKDESLAKEIEDYLTVGCIMSDGMYKNTKMREILKDNFNSITAENEAKPDSVLDQAACQQLAKTNEKAVAISTAKFEKIYDWCEAHHIPVRHHTFVWHQQTPSWFFNKGYVNGGERVSRDVMIGRLNNYIRTMIETLDDRWPGLVYALDIVNEAIEEVDQIRTGNWLNTIGDDYIYQAFKAAHKYKMDYQDVYYNDYAFEQTQWHGVERCQWAVDTMLKDAIDEGLVDGVGIQGHIEFSDVETILTDARIIHEAGIKCQITELDINCDGEKDFQKQKEAYYTVVKSVLDGNEDDTMDVNAIIVWGVTDNTSWHSNRYPLMFDSNYGKKPAYYGFLEAIEDFLAEQ